MTRGARLQRVQGRWERCYFKLVDFIGGAKAANASGLCTAAEENFVYERSGATLGARLGALLFDIRRWYTRDDIVAEERLMAKTRTIPSVTDFSWVDELSLKQLTKLAEEIRSQIAVKREEAKDQLRQELLEKAREFGIDPAQLVPARRLNRTEVKPKYRAPDGTTWAGRGRAPKVFQELFAKGHSKDEFLIKP